MKPNHTWKRPGISHPLDVRAWDHSTSMMTEHEIRCRKFPGLESLILLAVTSLAPALSNVAIGWVTTALTAIATTAIVAGINYLLNPMPDTPKPPDGKVPKSQTIPPRIFGVGTDRVAGYYMLWESKGPRLYAVFAMCGHEVDGYEEFYLNDDHGVIGVDDFFDADVNDGRYLGRVWIQTRNGAVPETSYDRIVDALGGEGVWTDNHRGDGQASLGMVCDPCPADDFQKRYPYGAPQPSAVMRLAKVWDVRDELQSPDYPETWTHSKNPALCLIWWLCFSDFGPKWDYRKAILPTISRWREEADICDEEIPLNVGGTEPRYEINGWATTETDPIAILNAFLAACDGHLVQHGDGSLVLTVGKFREELVTVITDADIVGHYIQGDVPEEDEINRFIPRFKYPAADYSTSLTDYFESIPDQLRFGRILSQEGDFSWVHSWRQARRLGKREWLRMQQKKSGTFDLRLSAINSVYSRWIRIESTYRVPKLNGKLIENRRAILALQQGGFQMEWKLHPENIDEWVPSTDEGTAPPVPLAPDNDEMPTPDIDTVVAVASGTDVILRVVIVDPNREDLTPVIRYRLTDAGSGNPGPWITQAFPDAEPNLGLIVLDTNPVRENVEIDIEVNFRGPKGSDGDTWADGGSLVTSINDTPPIALTAFGATGGNGRTVLNFTSGNDANLSKVAVYRVPTGVTLDTNVHDRLPLISANPNSTWSIVDGPASPIANLLTNPDFALAAPPPTLGTGWTVGSGTASHSATSGGALAWGSLTITNGTTYRAGVLINSISGSGTPTMTPRFTGSVTDTWTTAYTTSGLKLQSYTATQTGNNTFSWLANTNAVINIDNVVLFAQTVDCAPQGVWDYYAIPLNISEVPGPTAPAATGIVVY